MAVLDHTVLPPAAGESDLEHLITSLKGDSEVMSLLVDGVTVALPPEAMEVLRQALSALASGQAVTVVPHQTTLTTQEAADFLGVSRPTLIKLLEAGHIAFNRPGRHRRVELADVLEYQRSVRTERRRALAEMASEAADNDSYAQVNGFVETR